MSRTEELRAYLNEHPSFHGIHFESTPDEKTLNVYISDDTDPSVQIKAPALSRLADCLTYNEETDCAVLNLVRTLLFAHEADCSVASERAYRRGLIEGKSTIAELLGISSLTSEIRSLRELLEIRNS